MSSLEMLLWTLVQVCGGFAGGLLMLLLLGSLATGIGLGALWLVVRVIRSAW